MSTTAEIPAVFEREHGFTESEWQRCLPGAAGEHALTLPAPGEAVVRMAGGAPGGRLYLRWAALPPRRIALLSMPRLHVQYCFEGVDAPARREFMRYFDLYIQRGGG